ncbi:YqaJ viral recombinase family protein [Paractinoplanes maris]|uniref:YqaJ viral recombinase family protein n=1 Tax=Paractinoplanes maris TaxID=1734446 RepID=UPI00201FBFAB|nr:YqaJ viral recombinase family protein [Actinoplanes maris]
MSSATLTGPVGVIGWELDDDAWREQRKHGLGGSDISAVLGFSGYTSPWAVWAEKTGVRSWQDDISSAAADLGVELEPWLLGKAARLLGVDVTQPEFRTYAHPVHRWRTCSPDGISPLGLIELKTAGLASGFGSPPGWADGGTPLGYEFQCRWSLHVMDAARIDLIGLVAGMGVVHRTFHRDLAIEADLVDQVSEWHRRHIVGGVEPPLGAVDNDDMLRRYPVTTGATVDLSGTHAAELHQAYLSARARESRAKADKEAAGAALKNLIGVAEAAEVEDKTIAKWSAKKGSVDWPALVAELVEKHSLPAPNPESYRKPSSRTLYVKEV